jgi:hypothetical protein
VLVTIELAAIGPVEGGDVGVKDVGEVGDSVVLRDVGQRAMRRNRL